MAPLVRPPRLDLKIAVGSSGFNNFWGPFQGPKIVFFFVKFGVGFWVLFKTSFGSNLGAVLGPDRPNMGGKMSPREPSRTPKT